MIMLTKPTTQKTTFLFFLLMILLSANPVKSVAQVTINLDISKLPANQIDIIGYLDDMFIIPLETKSNNLMGQNGGIEQDATDIFYLSRENQTIYHYTATGKFLNSFCRLGKGPGEYSDVRKMRIVPGTQTLILSDPRQNKMIRVSYTGELINEFKLPQSTAWFVVLNQNLIALHGGKMIGLDGKEPIKSDLQFLDLNGQIISRKFPFENPLSFEFSNAFTRPNADGSYYYSKQFDFNLYRVADTTQPQIAYKLNYGKAMGSLSDLTGSGIDALGALRKEGKKWSIDQTVNTFGNLALINFKDRKSSLLLIDKKSNKLLTFGSDSLSVLGNYYGFPVIIPRDSYKTHFLTHMDAIDVYALIQKLTPDQISTLKKKVKGFDRIVDIKPDDNPVLIYYRFKEFR